ncbi:hypothetical protein N8692_04930, partial [Flavobacteriales bacterium]|nr:hypothetical protein [Flavobacteriales bacterium]
EVIEQSNLTQMSSDVEWNEDKEIYIVYNTQALNLEQAVSEVDKLKKEGFKGAGCLYIPNFVSFSGNNIYIIFSSKHDTSADCALEVDEQLKTNEKAYGLFVSKFQEGIRINGVGKTKSLKFNNSNPLYKSIRNFNIVLLIIWWLVEIIAQESAGKSAPNGSAVIITFLLSRAWIRHLFLRKPQFRTKSMPIKLGTTFLIWTAVFIIKSLIIGIILNVAL